MKNSIGKILKKFSYIFILVLSLNVNSQIMINPYLDYNTFSPTIIQSLNYGAPNITSPPFLYDWSQPPINGGYTGEYMITMQDHFWRIAYPNNALSYKVEVVGFPFTMSCWDQPQSCAYPISPLSTRDMYMPDDSYNSVPKKWNNLVNVRSNGEFTRDIGGSFIRARKTAVSVPFNAGRGLMHQFWRHCSRK